MPRKQVDWFERAGVFIIPLVAFFGGMLIDAVKYSRDVATVPYVDQRHEESKKYTDDKARETLERAISHSDMNHQDMMLRLEALSSDVKSYGVKLDTVLDSLKDIKVGSKHK